MQVNQQKLNQFVDIAIADLAAGYGGVMIGLGHKLGLYKALDGAGPLSSWEVASRAGCAERYVREWLNSQAAAGYVDYHPESETYELTVEQALVLADENSSLFLPPAWEVPVSMWFDEDKSIEAFRSGRGVGWNEHNRRLYQGCAAFYRTAYRGHLVSDWLPALESTMSKLEAGAKIADIGCGHGHSTIIMAEAFPKCRFWGFDAHTASIDAARKNARQAGLAKRVLFEIADAKHYSAKGFDLICFFDCLHDMGDPVGAAQHAREALDGDGSVMLVEPYADDRVEGNFNAIGRLYFSASTTLCCAHSLSEDVGLALGAQAGEKKLASVFKKAGFRKFRTAKKTPFNLILEARP